ncbi:MAG: hypothetical protein C4329_13855 [Chitinophagaceae bacterium]
MSNVDVISDILSACVKAFPESNFVQSLAHQYLIRGWLSKKQMEGLYDKAKKLRDFSPGKLATLQAQIQRLPTRYKSSIPTEVKPLFEKDEQIKKLLAEIIAKYPQHKRILFLQAKLVQNQLSETDKSEIKKFHKLLLKHP